MLTDNERRELQMALWDWAKSAPNEAAMGFLDNGTLLTPVQLAESVASGSPDGEAILEFLEHGVRREGMQRVIERLRRRSKTFTG